MVSVTLKQWAVLAIFSAAVAAACAGGESETQIAGGKDSAIIRMVMGKAMKGGLANKFSIGTATADEKAQLIVLFTMLAGCDCPKGDAKAWNERTAALLTAVTGNDAIAFRKAVNCAGCHKAHK